MDIQNVLLSSGITTFLYGLYKGYKNYYLKSSCHDQSLTIEIVTNHPTPPEEHKEPEVMDAVEVAPVSPPI